MYRSIKVSTVVGLLFWWSCALFLPNLGLGGEFRILYPKPNDTVGGEIGEVEGEGALPGAKIEASVLTNEWFLQDGRGEINSNGNWTYGPCYLKGKGKYNNHTIRVRLIKDGKVIATATVRGIVRQE
jgi:hypothetical protein